ncbi:MAG: threonine-phosphate decarboxylase [Deltaproteobacteria bacterium]|nr:threonine-phosphate decarboxylase [Deltaproteobacteria bacterium]
MGGMKDTHGGNIWEAAQKAGLSPEGIIDFSASINPAGLCPGARTAVRKALRLIASYPEPAAAALKKALSAYHGICAEEILPGNGSTELIRLIPQVLKPKKALIAEPAFSEYRRSLEYNGCKVDSLVLRGRDGFSLDVDRFKKAVQKGRPDIAYLCNPSNPTGVLMEKEAIVDLAGFCEKAGTVLVVDEAFMDFCEGLGPLRGLSPFKGQSVKKEAARFKNLLVLRSMTKFFGMAGLRSGCLIAHRGVIKRFSGNIPPWSVNTLAQAASVASLGDGAYIRNTLRWLEREKGFLTGKLGAMKGLLVFPSAANFLMLRINAGGPGAPELKARLFKKGILIRDLAGFKGLGPAYCRIAVKERRENALLVNAFGDIFS